MISPVAAGVLTRPDGRVLVCERPQDQSHAGFYEFPGGKLEPGETPEQALHRELNEEIGVDPLDVVPLIRLEHFYPEYPVRLYFFRVTAWQGTPAPRLGQTLMWKFPQILPGLPLFAANRSAVNALRLPRRLLVAPDPTVVNREIFLDRLEGALNSGRADGVVFRTRNTRPDPKWLRRIIKRSAGHPVMCNSGGTVVPAGGFSGLHLPAGTLQQLRDRPRCKGWVGASVHTPTEAEWARALGLDYVLIGNVGATSTHPGCHPLGWFGFEEVAWAAGVPAYAIGGMHPGDYPLARSHWAQGVAGIRAFGGG